MISVAMTTYNGEKYITEQLRSIYDQTRTVDELIICDDGSTDHTIQKIYAFQDTHSDLSIRLIQNKENLGYKLNFKKAMSLCSGDFVFLCDQDDVWKKEKVETMVSILKKHADIKVLASSFTFIDENDKEIHIDSKKGYSNNNMYTKEVEPHACVEVTFQEFLEHNYFQGCSLCIRKDIIQEVLSHYSTKIHHDWLINSTAAKHHGMYFLNTSLFYYRMHQNNAVGVPDMNASRFEHLFNKHGLDLRIHVASEALEILDALYESDPDGFMNCAIDLPKRRAFYIEYVQLLKSKKAWKIIKENTDPIYRETISLKGRILDIWFTLIA